MSHAADPGDPFAADPDMNHRADWRENTITRFPAITCLTAITEAPAPVPAGCQCKMPGCPDGPPLSPGHSAAALLSCASGVVSRMWRTRVSNGQWDSIPGEFDRAHAAIHMPALDSQRAIRGEVDAKRHDIAVMFTRRQDLLSDRVIADGLHGLEATLASRLADMKAEAAERSAAA